jgi:ABC-type uncharacterized transport system auxiliary subunit
MRRLGAGKKYMGRLAVLLLAVLPLLGCFPSRKPPVLVKEYVLEYAPPSFEGRVRIPVEIKVQRFGASRGTDTPQMVFTPGPYERKAYNYHRWMVPPADMVTDYLTRDLQGSGLLEAVFSWTEAEQARFVLTGGVEKFLEVDAPEGEARKAVLVVNVTFLDTSRKEIPERVLFQKTYRETRERRAKSPAGLAGAMSEAMRAFSKALIQDVYRAARARVEP